MMQAQYYDRDGRPASSGTRSSDLMPRSTRSGLRNVVWPRRGDDGRLARRHDPADELSAQRDADTLADFFLDTAGGGHLQLPARLVEQQDSGGVSAAIEQVGAGCTPVQLAKVLAADLRYQPVRPPRPAPPTAGDYARLAGLAAGGCRCRRRAHRLPQTPQRRLSRRHANGHWTRMADAKIRA